MSAETYRRWAAGRCPCCGGIIADWEDQHGEITDPQAVAEGVTLCGRCIANEHHRPADFLNALLEAIARRSEEPIDRLLPGTWLNCMPARGDSAVRA